MGETAASNTPTTGSSMDDTSTQSSVYRNLRHNTLVNLGDGAFFGFAFGFNSYVTILPLFVSLMTDTPVLIGLIPALHTAGWQLPQLFLAGWVARQQRVKPIALTMTLLERLPYLGLALLAFSLNRIDNSLALGLAFFLLILQGVGAGLTSVPWQMMISKVIPGDRRGTFFGMQNAGLNLFAAIGSVIAGQILARVSGGRGFGYSLLISSGLLVISWFFLAATREPLSPVPTETEGFKRPPASAVMRLIMRQDNHFRWFMVGRFFSMIALTGYAFYTVYAVSKLGVSKAEIGVMTGGLMAAQLLANLGMGWVGDRLGHRPVMVVGLISLTLGALLAWRAPGAGWFYLVYVLTALGSVAIWTVGMIMTLEFGREEERPLYIGLSATLLAPVNILAPFAGGWIAAAFGYPSVFLLSAAAGLIAVLIFQLLVPRHKPQTRVSFLDERRPV